MKYRVNRKLWDWGFSIFPPNEHPINPRTLKNLLNRLDKLEKLVSNFKKESVTIEYYDDSDCEFLLNTFTVKECERILKIKQL